MNDTKNCLVLAARFLRRMNFLSFLCTCFVFFFVFVNFLYFLDTFVSVFFMHAIGLKFMFYRFAVSSFFVTFLVFKN